MENLYLQTTRLLGETQYLMQQMLTVSGNVQETQLKENLEHLAQDVFRLQTMARKEVPSRRQEANMRVEQLNSDLQTVQRAYLNYQQRLEEAEQEAKQREELLMRRYTTNNAAAEETSIAMDLQHHQKLSEANSNLDSLLSHGSNVIENLRSQRFTLKGAHRKLLDLTSTLGLSNTVMRLIEKRTEQDKWIFWTGLLVTSIILCLIIYYFVL